MRKALAAIVLIAISCCGSGCAPRHHPPGRARGWGHPNPRLVIIAGTDIKYVADVEDDIFVYGGVWYRYSGEVWFTCRTYGGTWVRVSEPPVVFYKIPPGHAKHHVVRKRRAQPGKGPGPGPKGPGHGRGRGRGRGRW